MKLQDKKEDLLWFFKLMYFMAVAYFVVLGFIEGIWWYFIYFIIFSLVNYIWHMYIQKTMRDKERK